MNNALILTSLLLQYSDKVMQMASLLKTAQSEGRDITAAELDTLFGQDDAARAQLQAAIDAATQGG